MQTGIRRSSMAGRDYWIPAFAGKTKWWCNEAGLYTMPGNGKSMEITAPDPPKAFPFRGLSGIMLTDRGSRASPERTMDKDRAQQDPANLERVIEKNRQYLDSVAEDLLKACVGARSAKEVPPAVIENVLQVYGTMKSRLLEIDSVQKLLLRRHHRQVKENPKREKLIAELDAQIKVLSARLGKSAQPAAGGPPGKGTPGGTVAGTPSDRWLRIDDNSLAFTINARLLDELEYEPPAPAGGPSKRRTHQSGRGFTLFSIRGPAAALDDLIPRIKLRQHDIIERFSASEIRGVLTHLRRTTAADITHIFHRLLASRFPDLKCILVGLSSPDQLNDSFLKYLDRLAEEMRSGELRTIDIADHG